MQMLLLVPCVLSQAPLQPWNEEPSSAVACKETVVLTGNEYAQLVPLPPQLIPGLLDTTVPLPVPEVETVSSVETNFALMVLLEFICTLQVTFPDPETERQPPHSKR